jgi:hypothetical protein
MATYTINTTRTQEIGLKFSYDTYADKEVFTTQQAWFQRKISEQVTNPMYKDQQRANSIAFDQSFNTIPEAEQPAAKAEMEEVITSHGGTIIPPGQPPLPLPPNPGVLGGSLFTSGGEGSPSIQAGAGDKESVPTSRPDGNGDN